MPPIPPGQISPYEPRRRVSPIDTGATLLAMEGFVAHPLTGPPPIAYSIASTVQATGGALTRTRVFELIKSGELDARKVGRRTVVMADSLRAFLERQPKAAA